MPPSSDQLAVLDAAHEALPVELVEVRPGRTLAIHSQPRPGAEQTVLFVHGSCGSLLQWKDQIALAAKKRAVVAFDTFGCGRSPKPPEWDAYSFAELRDDLAAVLARFSVPGRTMVVVAHSAGCSLALAVAAASLASTPPGPPIDGLCLMGAFAEPPRVPSIFYLPTFVLSLMQPRLSAGFEALALHADTRAGKTAARRYLLGLAPAVNAANDMFMCKAYYRQLSAPSKEEIQSVGAEVPCLLIAGEDDALVPPESTAELHALLSSGAPSEMHSVRATSHQLMQEDPEAVNALLGAFLQSVYARPKPKKTAKARASAVPDKSFASQTRFSSLPSEE